MPALGLVLAWGGYWFLTYGLALRKNTNVTLLDMASPKQRSKVISEMSKAWAKPPDGTTGGSSGGGLGIHPFPGPQIPIPGTGGIISL